MGMFDSISNAAGGFFESVTGTGNPMISFLGEQGKFAGELLGLNGKSGDPRSLTDADRKYLALREKQSNEAKKFRSDIPTYESQLGENIDQDIRGDLKNNLASSQVDANKRGLLRSGIQQGRDLGYRAQAGAESANKRSQLSRELGQQADAYDQAVVEAGRKSVAGDVDESDRAYSEALEKRKNQSGILSGLMGATGKGIGSYLGSKE